MKIGIETSSLHWNRQGGVSRLLKSLLCAFRDLKNSDIEFYLFHYCPGYNHLYNVFPDVTPQWLQQLPSRITSKIMPATVSLQSFDIVHYPCEDLSPIFWLAGRKVIVTVHAAALHSLPVEYRGPPQPRSWWISLRYLHRFITRIVTDSEFARKEIATYYKIPVHKITVVPLGVDLDVFHPMVITTALRQHLRKSYNIHTPYILDVCSSYQALKNIPRLLDAFAQCKRQGLKHKLVIAGGGGGWQHEKVYQAIADHNLHDDVILTGYIEEDDMPVLYSAAELFVFPSLYEGFGLSVLEAMACGCPVITSQVSSLPEVAGDAAILVDPYNITEIADTIKFVISNPAEHRRMRGRGLERVKSFTWEASARAMIKVYRECYHR